MSILSTHRQDAIVGGRLLAVREASGLTQTEMAQRLNITMRAYANYERGEREMPLAVLHALYARFGIDPVWIMAGPGKEPVMAGQRRLDGDLLERIIAVVNEDLRTQRRTLKPEKMARLVRLAYEHCTELGVVDKPHIAQMLSLAA
ncbi:MAG: helix-turn-helix domain-containing protein [Rudaea sp.]